MNGALGRRNNIAAQPIDFDALTRDELNAVAGDCTIVVPLGSTEQHSHYLPTRTDTAVITEIARRAALVANEQVRILVAPPVSYGCSHHHLAFGGTISLKTTTYVELLCDIVGSLATVGFRSVVLLNGHGGNGSSIRLVADRVAYEERLAVHLAATGYSTICHEVLVSHGFGGPEHAGDVETSLMLALSPELVHLDRRPSDALESTPLGRADIAGATIRRPNIWANSDGRTSDARHATSGIGTALLADMVKSIAAFLVQFHRSTQPGGTGASDVQMDRSASAE